MARDIDQYVKDYTNKDYDFERILVKYRRKKILEFLKSYQPKHILEVGCGEDSIFNYFSDYESFTIVEPSKFFCEGVKQSKNFNSNVQVIQGFLEEESKKLTNHFDFIVVSSLLHEVENPSDLLKAIHSLCNSNTICHINVPNALSFHLLWAHKAGLFPTLYQLTENAQNFQRHSTFDLKQLIDVSQKFGFSVVESGSYFVKLFDHKNMQTLVNQKILTERLLDGLNDLAEFFPNNGAEIFVNVRKNA